MKGLSQLINQRPWMNDVSMKLLAGPLPVAAPLVMFIVVLLLGIAMKSLPVGTAYAVWVGVGAVGTVVLGMVLATALVIGLIALGLPGWSMRSGREWRPAAIVQLLSTELQRIYRERDVMQRLAPLGYEPAVSGSSELATVLAADLKKWERLVREVGIHAE